MYCKTDSSCIPYPIGEVIPSSSVCALDKARWAVCWREYTHLYLYKYENVCLFVCLFAHVFLGHFETDWETLWHKVSFCFRKCSKTIKFQKKLFFAELLPFFYISLRFLCKFEERLYPVTLLSPCFSISPVDRDAATHFKGLAIHD